MEPGAVVGADPESRAVDASATDDLVEVAVLLPVPGTYHYRLDPAQRARARVGARVLVGFGPRKVSGVIVRGPAELAASGVTEPAVGKPLKRITELLDDDEPALPVELVGLCGWIADYYEAPIGEVLRAALPAGTSVAAAGVVEPTDAGLAALAGDGAVLPARQRDVLATIAREERMAPADLTPRQRGELPGLIAAGLVERAEARSEPRTRLARIKVARLADGVDPVAALALTARAPRRRAVIAALAGDEAGDDAGDAVARASTPEPAAASDGCVAAAASASASANAAALVSAAANAAPTGEGGADGDRVADGDGDGDGDRDRDRDRDGDGDGDGDRDRDRDRDRDGDRDRDRDRDRTRDGGGDRGRDRAEAIVPVAELSAAIPGAAAALRELVKAGLVTIETRAIEPVAIAGSTLPAAVTPPVLTAEQRAAHTALAGALDGGFAAALLHGVTGSGKTEVYLHVIADVLAKGQTAIVLVPEISLTPQLAARFSARFGDLVAVLHSGLSDRERLGEWRRLRHGTARIALGARSAVFAPVTDLGVIVVDEEHDGSFKQDEGVRYHARDVALVRAQRAGALCVLGSATPSLETAHAAHAGRYQLLRLTQRPTASPLPAVEIIDLRTHMADGEAMLSAPLARAIEDTLAAGDQTILFLNRRGFATFVLCVGCGHSFKCRSCSVSLTYHQHQDRLICHYCGFTQRVPEVCPSCAARGTIERKGLGTERIAASVAARFPSARVARLDRDVASGARIEPILARVARREIDILVGTQMVTKGHDFPGVTLVGVLCADTGLSLPDFRAAERTYQLLSQVAGRAGRGDRPGTVLIQTYRPREAAVTCAAVHDYDAFYEAELANRAELGYPPHGRLIAIRIDGPNPPDVADTARRLAQIAEQNARGTAVEVRGPVPAPLARLRGRTRWQLWLRSPDRGALRRIVRGLRGVEAAASIRVAVDVDPMSAL